MLSEYSPPEPLGLFPSAHLQLLNDVLVIRATQWLLAWPCPGRDPPVLGGPLYHVTVDLERQSVDLTVQVHWDSDGPCLSWERTQGVT